MYRRMAWAGGALLAIALVVGIFSALRIVRVARDLREARELTTTAGDKIEAGDLAAARLDLLNAEKILVRSNADLYNRPELDAFGWVPGIKENLDSVRKTVSVALGLVSGGERITALSLPLQNVEGRLEVPLREGAIPIDTIRDLQIEVSELAQTLPGPAERPRTSRLVGPVAEAQTTVFDEAVRRRTQLNAVARGLTLLSEMSGGNGARRYLIAVANTAEMRGTGGMILSYGVLEGANGDFQLPAFGNIDELFLDKALAAPLPPDEAARWTGFEPNRLWRNVNVIPDLAEVGPRMAAMYQASTGQLVDGVIQIDASGLAAILKGIGPITVDGVGDVNADNAVDLTLNQAYTLFPDRDQRQEVLGDVAEATFRRLVDGEYASLRPLGEALAQAAVKGHVVMWSSHGAAAGPTSFFHADGAVPGRDAGDSFMLTVQNTGRNKLDYYLGTAVTVTGTRGVGQVGLAHVEVVVANNAPPDTTTPAYVFGDGSVGVDPGTYVGISSFYVPDGTSLASTDAPGAALTTEGGRSVIGWQVEVAPGESRTFVFELALAPRPRGLYALTLKPLPRVKPTIWTVDLDTGLGHAVFTGPLEVPITLKVGETT